MLLNYIVIGQAKLRHWNSVDQNYWVTSSLDLQLVDHLRHKSALSQSDQHIAVSVTEHFYATDLLVS